MLAIHRTVQGASTTARPAARGQFGLSLSNASFRDEVCHPLRRSFLSEADLRLAEAFHRYVPSVNVQDHSDYTALTVQFEG